MAKTPTPGKSLLRALGSWFHTMRQRIASAAERAGLRELKKLRWQNFLLLIAAGCINAVGVTMFLAPVNLYDSGISGTSMLLWQVTPETYTLSLFLIILNVPLFLFGLPLCGAGPAAVRHFRRAGIRGRERPDHPSGGRH